MSRIERPGDHRLRTYRDATEYLRSLVRTPRRTRSERERLGLTPIESLLDRMGNPHRAVPAIHITGSKGKGSTAFHTEALLTASGVRTGTFTSPHLDDWTERIRIAGAPIHRTELVGALERVRPAISHLQAANADAAPAFFDALVAAAFSVFANAPVDIAVIEAGIGARLDPTRICRAIATCITSVELEHTDRLGPTIADIAREKAAIARPGVPLVIGRMSDAARAVVEREAGRVGAPIRRLGRDITIRFHTAHPPCDPATSDSGGRVTGGTDGAPPLGRVGRDEISLAGRTVPVSLRQPGSRMLENAALALALASDAGALDRLDDTAAGDALGATMLPGRMEVLRESPLVIADGAHTCASIAALLEMIEARCPTRLVAVVSVTAGKDAGSLLSPLVRRAGAVFATAAEPTRSLRADELKGVIEAFVPATAVTAIDTPGDAIRAAIDAAGSHGTICATGSMYMAGAARRALASR